MPLSENFDFVSSNCDGDIIRFEVISAITLGNQDVTHRTLPQDLLLLSGRADHYLDLFLELALQTRAIVSDQVDELGHGRISRRSFRKRFPRRGTGRPFLPCRGRTWRT